MILRYVCLVIWTLFAIQSNQDWSNDPKFAAILLLGFLFLAKWQADEKSP